MEDLNEKPEFWSFDIFCRYAGWKMKLVDFLLQMSIYTQFKREFKWIPSLAIERSIEGFCTDG